MPEVTLGVDIGTTAIKGIAYGAEWRPLAHASVPTTWHGDESGGTVLDLAALRAAADRLIRDLTAALPAATRIGGLGITGMAETGVLLDGRLDRGSEPIWPAIAWHDARGSDQAVALAERDPAFAREFTWRTGLPLDGQATFSKLLWLVGHDGAGHRGVTWLSVPEYVAWCLTGTAAAERSLVSRTGLYDHTRGSAYTEAFDRLGLDPAILPPVRAAEQGWPAVGPAHPDVTGAAAALGDARITVAGHDHVVASVGQGIDAPGQLFNSCGTADVVIRVVDRWPDAAATARLAPHNVSLGNHPIPGRYVVNGGTKAGLVLGRLTELLGPIPPSASASGDPGGATVVLPPGGSDVLQLRLAAQTGPDQLWNAGFAALRRQSHEALRAIEAEFGASTGVVCAGGWINVPAVRRLRQDTYGAVTFSAIDEPGCLGAALAARPTPQQTAT